jgi:small subunit ribosomal protein S20
VAKRTASAKKQARAGAKRAARNRAVRSEVKTLIVKARKALSGGGAGGSEVAPTTLEAIRALDRAASKRVLHPRNAARRKGRLARQLAKVAVAAPAPAPAKGKKAAAAAPARKPAAASKKK